MAINCGALNIFHWSMLNDIMPFSRFTSNVCHWYKLLVLLWTSSKTIISYHIGMLHSTLLTILHKATLLLTLFMFCASSVDKDANTILYFMTSKYAFVKPFLHLVVLSSLRNSTFIRPVFICRIRYLSSLNTIAMPCFHMIPP